MSGDVGSTPGDNAIDTSTDPTTAAPLSAAMRIQARANIDREFWRTNYKPLAIQTAQEVDALALTTPRYEAKANSAQTIVNTQLGVIPSMVAREAACTVPACNETSITRMLDTKARAYAMSSALRAEEIRAEARNADRLTKMLEQSKLGRQLEVHAQSAMAQAAAELEHVSRQQSAAYGIIGEVAGTLANRGLNSMQPTTTTVLQGAFTVPWSDAQPAAQPAVNVTVSPVMTSRGTTTPLPFLDAPVPSEEKPPK